MSERDATVSVRVTEELRDRIDQAAQALAMNRSEWVVYAVENQLRADVPRQRIQVQRERTAFTSRRPAPSLCSHPLSLRSDPHPVSGESVCQACRAIVYPIR